MTHRHSVDPVRPLGYAGTWYNADRAQLARQVDGWLESVVPVAQTPIALVAPHAGLRYSGHVAAWSYGALRGLPIDTVIMVGPSHYASFRGVAVLRRGSVETPWGALPVDTGLAEAVCRQLPGSTDEHRAVHQREHSLELHLPLLARVCPDVRVVPILTGEPSPDLALALGRALAEVASGRPVFLAASSDLSHFEPRDVARRMDGAVLQLLDTLDDAGLARALDEEPGHACGGAPMISVLHAARALGADGGGVRRYADSGDVTGDTQQVVGYASAVWTRA